MPDVTGLPDLSAYTPEHLLGGDDEAQRFASQHAFAMAVQQWCTARGLDVTITTLNRHGHAFRNVPEAAAGWRIFREPGPDGTVELQISHEEETGEIMLTTPMSDAAWTRQIAERNAALSPEERELETLRERFHERAGALWVAHGEHWRELDALSQAWLCLHVLDREIQNGGFAQYFVNTGGDLAGATVNFLREIGAGRAVDLLTQAMEWVGGPFSDPLREEQYEAIERHAAELEQLDAHWYDAVEDLAVLAARQWPGEGDA